MHSLILAAVLFLSLTVPPAQAAEAPAYAIDPAHCAVTFAIKHIFVQIPGRFNRVEGGVRFDPANLAGSGIDLSVDVASIDTAVAKRDEHLRSPDFFDAAAYPKMTFKSTAITHLGGNGYLAKGKLTIKDVSREVEIGFVYLGAKMSPMDQTKTVAGFECQFPVALADYHIGEAKWQAMGVLGEAAKVTLAFEMLGR